MQDRVRPDEDERSARVDTLWAPWRMEFIRAPKREGCIFCTLPSETGLEKDRENLVLGRTPRSFVLFNRYPYTSGHLMVVPRRHTADFTSLSVEESADLHGLLKLTVGVLAEALRPQGYNLGMNLGHAAGAGIADHLHYHVVPRWVGDTNFMPLVAQTRVVIEHLTASFDELRPHFDRRLSSRGEFDQPPTGA